MERKASWKKKSHGNMIFIKHLNVTAIVGNITSLFLALILNPLTAQPADTVNFCNTIKMDLSRQLPRGWALQESDRSKIEITISDSVLYFWPANDVNPSYDYFSKPQQIEGKIKYVFSIYFKTGKDHWNDTRLKYSLAHNDSIKVKISEAGKVRRNSFQSYMEWKKTVYVLNSLLKKLPAAKNNIVTVFTEDNLYPGFLYFYQSDMDKNNLIKEECKFYSDRKTIREICQKAINRSFGIK